MGLSSIDGILLKKMIIAGANLLNKNKQLVDSLNVFPVPDGDTGTNMSLTVFAAAKEVYKLNTPNIHDVAKAASSGSLRGARGNSGVIVSQLFRGFAKGLENVSVANFDDFCNAFTKAQETAYKAVMKPKEGTILTIAKALSQKSLELSFENNDCEENLKLLIKHGEQVLEKTRDMLPELKQADVVDAGGLGLLFILKGALYAISYDGDIEVDTSSEVIEPSTNVFDNIKTEDIKFAYCTEFIVDILNDRVDLEDHLKKYYESIGDSIVVVVDDGLAKVHVHTNNPGKALEKAITIGNLTDIKIENMKQQHTSKLSFSDKSEIEQETQLPKKDQGFISVAVGEGLIDIFKNYGADYVIEGGQTMNPSTDDILNAIKKVNAENIIILPNNKNIILAAKQAAELCTDKNIFVIETKSIPQGVTALVNQIPTNSVDENILLMNEAIKTVKTGQVTHAVRDTSVNNLNINKGDILLINEGNIILKDKDIQNGTKKLIDFMIDEESSFVSIYFGKEATEEMAQELENYIKQKNPDCDVEIYNGTQPVYYYFISVE